MLVIEDNEIEAEKTIEDEKMELELRIADIIQKQKDQADAFRLKMKEQAEENRLKIRKLRRIALEKDICLRYAFTSIVILVSIIIAMFGLLLGLLRGTR